MRVVIIGGGAAGTACAHSFVQTIAQAESGMADECGVTVVDPLEQPVELPPLSKSLAAQELSLVPHVLGENVVRVQATVSEVREAREASEVRPEEQCPPPLHSGDLGRRAPSRRSCLRHGPHSEGSILRRAHRVRPRLG